MTDGLEHMASRITEKELAQFWRVSPRTLQRWREAGTGPKWVRVGHRILYIRDDALSYEQHNPSDSR